MKCLLFCFSLLFYSNLFCQNDEKAIYIKLIGELTKGNMFKDKIVLINDSIYNMDSKEDFSLIAKLHKKFSKTGDWDSLVKHFDFTKKSISVTKYFTLKDVTSKYVKYKFVSQLETKKNIDDYWSIYLRPLYFDKDRTKCVAICDFLIGWCGTGATKYFSFKKDINGIWNKANNLF